MEVECFTKVDLTTCGDIVGGHTAFSNLLEDVADHHAQAEYLQSILLGRSNAIRVINQKLLDVASQLSALETMIDAKEESEMAQSLEVGTNDGIDISSCPESGLIKFIFDARSVDTDFCQEEEFLDDEEVECVDFELPVNASDKSLWNVHSCSIESKLQSFGLLENFTRMMNSVPIKISASLQKVEVHRSWFQPGIFEDSEHFTIVSVL